MSFSERRTSGNGEKKARREIANYNERRRMKSINDGFESLKDILPVDSEKTSKAAILQHANDYITELRQEILALQAGRTGVKTPPSAVKALPVTPATIAPVAAFTPPPTVVAVVTTKSPKRRRMSAPTSSVKKTGPAAAGTAGKAATIADRRSSDPTNRSLDVMLEAIDALERTAPRSTTKSMAGYARSPVTPEALSQPRVLWPVTSSPQKPTTQGVNPMSISFNNNISRRLEVGN